MTPSSRSPQTDFIPEADRTLGERFLRDGYVILPAEDQTALSRIRDLVVAAAQDWLGLPPPSDPDHFLNHIHENIEPARLNEFRLAVIQHINDQAWLRPSYFATLRHGIETIVGNELAMQRRVNLSIQCPDDHSSLLPVHADVWSGDSPFEVVLWIPLVDCFASKSMYILPPGPNAALENRFADIAGQGTEQIFRDIERDLVWLEVPYGSVLLFNQNLAHGNRVNAEADTRWSMNCRFKGAFTPYASKRLGEFFEPITLRPASRIGLGYRLPEVSRP